jgi:hypothetical protein
MNDKKISDRVSRVIVALREAARGEDSVSISRTDLAAQCGMNRKTLNLAVADAVLHHGLVVKATAGNRPHTFDLSNVSVPKANLPSADLSGLLREAAREMGAAEVHVEFVIRA